MRGHCYKICKAGAARQPYLGLAAPISGHDGNDMRLTCPNCGARYEVADSMIPPEGRDVQCSNCSTTWFQSGRPTDQQPGAAEDAPAPVPPPPGKVSGEGVAPPPPPRPEPPPPPEPEARQEPEPEPEAAAPAPPPAPEPVPQPDIAAAGLTPTRRALDPELRKILRQEADREVRLRRAEAEPVETQAEMPLGPDPADTRRAQKWAEIDTHDAEEGHLDETSARELFPDIEAINSSLRDTGDRSGTEADASDIDTLDTLPRRRRGTRIGFFGVLIIATAAAALYANADRVATEVPALTPALERYVTVVNTARFWLDDLAQGLGGGTPEG
jgi:predicted Zn finger-like uncharacterized protein